jgi:hypothetical protein
MATIDNKDIIDEIIKGNGYYEDDTRVSMIVEYTNAYGKQAYGVTWINQQNQQKYLIESEFIRNPKVIWSIEGTE